MIYVDHDLSVRGEQLDDLDHDLPVRGEELDLYVMIYLSEVRNY